MVLAMNIIMTVFATLVFTFSISFYQREKALGRIRLHILALGLTCGASNAGYILMSILPLSNWTLFLRNIGHIFLFTFIYCELYFVLDQLEFQSKKYPIFKKIVLIFFALYGIVALFYHSLPGDVSFVIESGYVTFHNNYGIGYTLISILSAMFFVVMFSLAIFWFTRQTSKRGKRFVFLCIYANLLYLISSFPYFLGVKTAHPAFLYCMGETLAFLVLWHAGVRLSGFSVTEQKLSTDIFSSINTGLLVFSDKGNLTIINNYAKAKLSISGVLSQTISDIFDVSVDEEKKIMNEIFSKGHYFGKFSIKNSNSIFSANFNLKMDSVNEPLCVICVVNDVTKEEDMIKEVLSANRAKSDFLASMSHEIRTPINAIIGMNEMIIRESYDQDILNYALDVESSGKMLLSLVNDILDFSKIESGKMDIVPVEYDLSSLINDIYTMLNSKAKEKGLEFKLNIDSNLPGLLKGDEIRVRQIVTNLLTNAIKYTEHGSVELAVFGKKISHEKGDYYISFRVSDTGKGIKEEELSKLFDSFTRLDEVVNRTIEGTGLGLSLTKSFVSMMDGDINVESVYGQGSSFTASIVQVIIDEGPIGNFSEKVMLKTNEREMGLNRLYAPDCKVLVVDDVAMNCKVFCGLLKESKIKIDASLSGADALERCKNTKYDLIFMDHRMPQMDGVECLHLLKSMESPNINTPVVVLTANAISGMREMYLKEGFVDYLTKPIDFGYLEETIRNLVPQYIKEKPLDEFAFDERLSDDETVSDNEENKEFVNPYVTSTNLSDMENEFEELPFEEIFPELNKELGMKYCMNSEDFYIEMVKEYAANDKTSDLEESLNSNNIDNFRTYIHAVKSTSLNIGGEEISARAKALEQAAKDNDIDYIHSNYPDFLKDYSALLNKIRDNL